MEEKDEHDLFNHASLFGKKPKKTFFEAKMEEYTGSGPAHHEPPKKKKNQNSHEDSRKKGVILFDEKEDEGGEENKVKSKKKRKDKGRGSSKVTTEEPHVSPKKRREEGNEPLVEDKGPEASEAATEEPDVSSKSRREEDNEPVVDEPKSNQEDQDDVAMSDVEEAVEQDDSPLCVVIENKAAECSLEENKEMENAGSNDVVMSDEKAPSSPEAVRSSGTQSFKDAIGKLSQQMTAKVRREVRNAREGTFLFEPNLKIKNAKNYVYCMIDGVDINIDEHDGPDFIQLPWLPTPSDDPEKIQWCDRLRRVLLRYLDHEGHSVEQFENLVYDCMRVCFEDRLGLLGLRSYFQKLDEEGKESCLETLKFIVFLAHQAFESLPNNLRKLTFKVSVTLSQEQCACILAHAFLCSFDRERLDFSFIGIHASNAPFLHEKLECMLSYFRRIRESTPSGCVSFRKNRMSELPMNFWEESAEKIAEVNIIAAFNERIEDVHYCSQVDFANKHIGGGALTDGCLQEEIRFMICPEAIVSILLSPDSMTNEEAIFIVGAQQFNSYSGYGRNFKCRPMDNFGFEERDMFGIRTEIVAIDATNYSREALQYKPSSILRELNKLYVGFTSRRSEPPAIASGWWGCGAFRGDHQLKSLLQVVVAAKCTRDLVICVFGEARTGHGFLKVVERLRQRGATAGDLLTCLNHYGVKNRGSVFDHAMDWFKG